MTTRAPEYETYKSHDLIKIYTGRKWKDKNGDEQEESISFGSKKAQAICDNIDAIRIFAKKGEEKK
jgi:hypothetical protein